MVLGGDFYSRYQNNSLKINHELHLQTKKEKESTNTRIFFADGHPGRPECPLKETGEGEEKTYREPEKKLIAFS